MWLGEGEGGVVVFCGDRFFLCFRVTLKRPGRVDARWFFFLGIRGVGLGRGMRAGRNE